MQAMYYETYLIHLKYFLPPDISTGTLYPTHTRKHYKKKIWWHIATFLEKKQTSLKPQ